MKSDFFPPYLRLCIQRSEQNLDGTSNPATICIKYVTVQGYFSLSLLGWNIFMEQEMLPLVPEFSLNIFYILRF